MKLIGAAEILANFVESHGWYHPELKCTACSHEHTYKNIGIRICKYCKRVWSAHDSDCPLGQALDTVVNESNKPRYYTADAPDDAKDKRSGLCWGNGHAICVNPDCECNCGHLAQH